jgi:hypothetical protein
MKENVKKSTKVATPKSTKKVATKKAEKASKKSQVFLCMDVKFEGDESVIKVGETRNVRLKLVDEDNFLAVEKKSVTPANKGMQRVVMARTVHGTMSVDEFGVHIGFYFRHDEVGKKGELAEALESESEEMGDRILELEDICC